MQQHFQDLQNAFRDREEHTGTTGIFTAYLGNRAGHIIASTMERYVYYWTYSGDEGVAFLSEGCGIPFLENPSYAGKGVKIGYPPGVDSRRAIPHVLGLSREGLLGVHGFTPAEQAQNASLFPKAAQIDLYRVTPTFPDASYAVSISTGFVYVKSGGRDYWQKGNFDIPTSARPDAGKHRIALLVLDRSTNLPALILGTQATNANAPSANSGAFTIADVIGLTPGVTQDSLIILYLYGEQEVISETDCLRQYEVRQWIAGSASYYQTVQDNGTNKTQRGKLNFIAGSNVTVTVADNSGNDRTDITVAASGGGGGGANPSTCEGRLTLTSGTPITTSDVTAAATLYFTPYKGNQIGTYSGSAWTVNGFTEKSLSLSGFSASTPYDIFIVDSTLALEALAWTNDTTRATALVLQDGIYVKSGATTRRYLGTIRITGTTGQTEDSAAKRLVWNYYNRVLRLMKFTESADAWSYNGGWRSFNNNTANRVEYVCGLAEDLVTLDFRAVVSFASGVKGYIGIGVDSTSTNGSLTNVGVYNANTTINTFIHALYKGYPGIGYHYLQGLESSAIGTVTFVGDDGSTQMLSGGVGEVWA